MRAHGAHLQLVADAGAQAVDEGEVGEAGEAVPGGRPGVAAQRAVAQVQRAQRAQRAQALPGRRAGGCSRPGAPPGGWSLKSTVSCSRRVSLIRHFSLSVILGFRGARSGDVS